VAFHKEAFWGFCYVVYVYRGLYTFKDLGIVDEKLTYKDKRNKAYAMFGIINKNFKHMNINSFVLMYKSMV